MADRSGGSERRVSVERVIAAPAARIFDLLADPARHHEIDGSDSVVAPRGDAPERLSPGARFGMSMRQGVPYPVTNEVVEFEEGRLIAWRHLGHHVWRYELEPVDDGSRTRVVETFDWGPARASFLYPLVRIPQRNRAAMERTLERLDAVVTGDETG